MLKAQSLQFTKCLGREIHAGLPEAQGTYLVESIHLESKSINSGHAAHRVELGQLRSKVGVKRHIMEIFIRHLWLVSVLQVTEVV